ncbi:glycosyl hydrolase 108 family protein [Acetobacter oeni]|uniref:TtsA-like Glycoside hydrolase family 108 domain-containing protein n=1 Tax=Acetobacter oeni TaxID=304077 RepID=A0A511XLF5_9PROT|nr:glycosyl hydrolase 108 family protein [Acetobacter oeni]MBB3883554.1 lysozyme family protein [Acetobacter oeni]NHO19591.1 hypothetical protein [Acetobacter oeni]GBR03039.1 hypothetical protein AA21952_0933 [Acetobacter oeni LMG 21952]GEN63777.1 hypothetical protein AOE01nite_20010 [Acetobacter oeni]
MTGQNFDACLDFVRTAEGGYSDDPKDTGNWLPGEKNSKGDLIGSCYGVSAPMLASWMQPEKITADDMRNLDLGTFDAIARSRYWNPLACSVLPAGIDLMVFDFGWNCGVHVSACLLQRMTGATPDGVIGNRTLTALTQAETGEILPQIDPDALAVLHSRLGLPPSSGIGPEVTRALTRRGGLDLLMVLVLSGMQEREYRMRSGFRRWGKGWLARTRRRTETALAMVTAAAVRETQTVSL